MKNISAGKWDEKFKIFLKKYYWNEILQLANEYPDQRSLLVDFSDLEMFDRELADELLENPDDVIPSAKQALQQIDLPIDALLDDATVQFIKIPNKVPIRDIRSVHLLKFLAIEGMVRKATDVRPKVLIAAYKCLRCEHIVYIPQAGKKLFEPFECENETCGKKGPFEMLVRESTQIDAQRLQIQESPENLKGGTQPQSLDMDVEGALVGHATPGTRVIVNGTLRSILRITKEGKSPFYDIYLQANSIEYIDTEFSEIEITPEEEEEILKLSRDPQIYDHIVKSIAPSIYGYEDIKEALALQLFSGVPKHLPDGSRIRGDIHILLVGDPGIAKSQLLRYMVKLAPRGVFASGKSASSSGLTATAVKDDFGDGRWTLEAGALVMADMGIAAIDEMDKMRTEDKSSLHEAMEQQTISVAKAGILATLRSRCALLGAANPKYGRFDRYEGIAPQINMEPALMSRFDLIFVLMDIPDKERDLKIAEHIVKAHHAGEMSEQRLLIPGTMITKEDVDSEMQVVMPHINPEIMRKYIAYAKKNVVPVLEEDARKHLIDFYMNLRVKGEGKDAPVPVTARQLEALVRISEASARVRLSNVATLEDAKRTTKITLSCLKQVGIDPDTGAFDVDVLTSGTSKSQRTKIKIMKDIIRNVASRHSGGKAPLEEVYVEAEAEKIDREHAESLIDKMKRTGDLLMPDPTHVRII
ncbi:MAG: minichromosome maintenance protein MCM [Methanosarcinaceae archaeon]|nr:minichromosome maintenance protein MCM [Methanosarcinaceae archaeon]